MLLIFMVQVGTLSSALLISVLHRLRLDCVCSDVYRHVTLHEQVCIYVTYMSIYVCVCLSEKECSPRERP